MSFMVGAGRQDMTICLMRHGKRSKPIDWPTSVARSRQRQNSKPICAGDAFLIEDGDRQRENSQDYTCEGEDCQGEEAKTKRPSSKVGGPCNVSRGLLRKNSNFIAWILSNKSVQGKSYG